MNVDTRLAAMRAVDAILAALQSTFSLEKLIDGGNPYRFVPNDPINSTVWIADSEGRLASERGNARMMILVDRSDYTPMDMHLHNVAMPEADGFTMSDIGYTTVIVSCEGGNRVQSETLAAIVYQVIKSYRRDLMREFDIHNLQPLSVGRAQRVEVSGTPWVTTVAIRVETQETIRITEIANPLNHLDIVRVYKANEEQRLIDAVRLDGTLD